MANAIHSSKTFLYYKNTTNSTFEVLVPIKTVPQLGGEPAMIETTDLSATKYKTYIAGLQDMSSLSFTANYTKESWNKIIALTGAVEFEIRHGDNGENGVWKVTGEVTVYKNELAVDSVQEMTIVIVPHTMEDPSGRSRMRTNIGSIKE